MKRTGRQLHLMDNFKYCSLKAVKYGKYSPHHSKYASGIAMHIKYRSWIWNNITWGQEMEKDRPCIFLNIHGWLPCTRIFFIPKASSLARTFFTILKVHKVHKENKASFDLFVFPPNTEKKIQKEFFLLGESNKYSDEPNGGQSEDVTLFLKSN